MKNNKVLKLSIILGIILLIVIVFILKEKNVLSNFEYDILIEEHRYQYEGVDVGFVPMGGYSTNYFYTVINSEKKEKYTVVYQDVWEIHNQRGNIDTLKLKVTSITDEELQDAINKYGISNKKNNLKELIEKHVNEKYELTIEK